MPGAPGLAIFETWDRFAIAKLGIPPENRRPPGLNQLIAYFPDPVPDGWSPIRKLTQVSKAQNGWRLPKGVLFW